MMQNESLQMVLKQTAQALVDASFASVIFTVEDNTLSQFAVSDPNTSSDKGILPQKIEIEASVLKEIKGGNYIHEVDKTDEAFEEFIQIAKDLDCPKFATLPIEINNNLFALIWVGEREKSLTKTSLTPITSLTDLVNLAFSQIQETEQAKQQANELDAIIAVNRATSRSGELPEILEALHEQVKKLIGDFPFIVALYDEKTESIQIPYLAGDHEVQSIDTFPLGEGLTSILIRTQQPMLITKDVEKQMEALGAKIQGQEARSWMGVPLIMDNQPIGALILQDLEKEEAFNQKDLNIFIRLATQITGTIHNARLLSESRHQILQMQTAAEIARDISSALNLDELLYNAVMMIRDRFNFYHVSVFLIDSSGSDAVIRESTGEAGAQLKRNGFRLAVGSKSIVGYVSSKGEPLVVDDTAKDATHLPNPLLPDTRAEAAIPLKIGDHILGVLDVQSVVPFAFRPDNLEILQTLADQIAIAVNNTELFAEIQEHLSQHRLLHHITTSAASGTTLEEALSSAVKGLQVTLGGDRVSIMLTDPEHKNLEIKAWVGYSEEVAKKVIPFGTGITGWVAAHNKTLLVNDVTQDTRYIQISANTRSELAIPLMFRNDILGVLNVESEQAAAYTENDEEMLGTLAGSLAAIIANARLVEQIRKQAERERLLYEITSKIRRSTDIQTVITTTASELSRVTGARNVQVKIGIEQDDIKPKKN